MHSKSSFSAKIEIDSSITALVYFDQQMGAPHAICWSKSFLMQKQMILTSKRHVEHLLAGQNTQQTVALVLYLALGGIALIDIYQRQSR